MSKPLPRFPVGLPACYPAGLRDPWNAFQRKPDNKRVDVPWNTDFKPKLIGKNFKWGKDKHIEYEFDKGILEPDVFWAGLEDEIARVNGKLGLE